MDFESKLQEVSVIGAAGKMGRGIALLLAQEMSLLNMRKGVLSHQLHLIDSSENGLQDLRHFLKTNLKRFAEKKIIQIRSDFSSDPNLVSNEQMINAFVEKTMDMMRFSSHDETTRNSHLIFEAIVEDETTKSQLYKRLKNLAQNDTYFFTNTSSIPISFLTAQAGLEGKMVGFHFYNPPAVQKLVELIFPQGTPPTLRTFSLLLVKRLQKQAIESHDVAGFIGNGHFIREIHYACEKVMEWSSEMKLEIAIQKMDFLTRDVLLRPMGIFQLIDYVGIDVCLSIAGIMQKHLQEPLIHPLLEDMKKSGFIGGQNYDGSQKKGFFSYEGMQKKEGYSFENKQYMPLEKMNPTSSLSWKLLQKDPYINEKIKAHLRSLYNGDTWLDQAAQAYLNKSNEIADQLVRQGVAKSKGDVSEVLKLGFFHLYGFDEIPKLSVKDHA